MVRRGLRLLLSLEPDLAVCGEAQTQRRAFAEILRLRPDLAILDLRLKRGNGLALISQLRLRCPELKILVFTMHAEPIHVDQALAAGAHAFVPKEHGSTKAVDTIRRLARRDTETTKPRVGGSPKPGLPGAKLAPGPAPKTLPENPFRH